MSGCVLCAGEGGAAPVLWRDGFCRVVRASTDDYPAFLRVILDRHVKEMTDLDEPARMQLMRVVWAAEAVVRGAWQPDKVNLASFGNQVPHLHWHVIGRWNGDAHFPEPPWGAPRRPSPKTAVPVEDVALRTALARRLGAQAGPAGAPR